MWVWDKKDKAEQVLRTYVSLDHLPKIKGPDLDNFNFDDFINSYKTMGFQGSNLGAAIEILKEVKQKRQEGLKLFVAMTGNMISSGNREIITYLTKHKLVDGIVTTAAGIEEDIAKSIKPFHLGSFDAKGETLMNNMIGRIGNIYVPVDRYLYLERFLNSLFEKLYKTNKITSANVLIREAGLLMETDENTKELCKESFIYWASKNDIPVFCPAITDGTLGDIICFFKNNNPDFAIDVTEENIKLTKALMNADSTASLILGGGVAKHFLLNAAIFRDGFEYSVYITTAESYDGSDSGGNQEEAISWAKIKPDGKRVKITADATIVFPLVAAAVYKQ